MSKKIVNAATSPSTSKLEPSATLDAQIAIYVRDYNSTAAIGYISSMYDMCAFGSSGYAQTPLGPAFDPKGRIAMGSLTKSMTVVLLAQLLNQNKINGQYPCVAPHYGWDTTLGMIFPSIAAHTPYENVTIAAVSSMYGGFESNTDYWAYYSPDTSLMEQRANLTSSAFKSTPTSMWPNTTYLYSNWGYVILGHAAEVSMNATWEDLLIEYVIDPLEMSDTSSYYPFTAVGVSNWGHLYYNARKPLVPCNPDSPPYPYDQISFYQCDNCPNMGPAGTYSGSILNTSRYYQWVVQCAAGVHTQDRIPLTQSQCQLIQSPYGPDTDSPGNSFGYGWTMTDVQAGANTTVKELSYCGSNTLNIACINIYGTPINTIFMASTNGGGLSQTNEKAMISSILNFLKSAFRKGLYSCPASSKSASAPIGTTRGGADLFAGLGW